MTKVITSYLLPRVAAFATLGVLVGAGGQASAEGTLTGKALADRYSQCWQNFNEANWDEFLKCYGPGTPSVAPGMLPAKGGKAIVDKHAKTFRAALPDVIGELQLLVVSGRNAATIALMHGTHTGPLASPAGDIPPTNKRLGQVVAHSIESGPGAIASKEWFIQDGATFMAQLGLSKNPARAAIDKMPTAIAGGPVVVATGSAVEKSNLAAAKKAYALFNRHDKKLAETASPDIVDHDQTSPADITGVAAEMDHTAALWQMSSNVKCATPILFAAGDYTVAIGQLVGKNDGDAPAMGLKKTGKSFSLDFIEFVRWKDGKAVELWPFLNSMQLAMELGLMPPVAHAQK
ncbi:MAG TPA: ester cyclase [Polyangia bacterium]|nr:ester cyclase [Polyangia bacterium]